MKTILIITDGIGYSEQKKYNAFFNAKKPNYDRFFKEIPFGMIKTYGDFVGLPEGQMGNSEVGHMCLGSGRILYQDLVKINKAIENGSLFNNPALKTLRSKKRIHLIGLMSDGGVHSHINHILALALELQKEFKIYLHLITDGRDVLPQSALGFLEKLQNAITHKNIKIASLSGRFFAMDRDNRWDRIERAYNTIALGENFINFSPKEYLQSQYKQEIFDEFIEPACFVKDIIQKEDGIIFANFRSDRAREIVSALGNKDFQNFKRKDWVEVPLVTMTPYDKTFDFPVLFPKEIVTNTLAEVIAKNNLRQFHTAETEKYAHITFFFNGGLEEPYTNETRVLIPSPNVKTYDEKPEMSAKEVSDAVLKAIEESYDFIVVNFANGDMVGHTGNFNAAILAVEAVDKELGRIYKKAKENDYAFVLTSDHGNCEEMQNEKGEILTNHTIGEVWGFVDAPYVTKVKNGGLNNIAPTILKLLEIEIPKEMDEALF